jgi:hypothetical protein
MHGNLSESDPISEMLTVRSSGSELDRDHVNIIEISVRMLACSLDPVITNKPRTN